MSDEAFLLLPGDYGSPLVRGKARGNMPPPGSTAWGFIAAVIIANMLGTGVLSLPYAASALGWIPFATFLLLFCLGALYSGSLYARLFQAAAPSRHREVCVFADVARVAFGRRIELMVRLVSYTYIGGVTVIFHITATEALKQSMSAFPAVCTYSWSAIVGGVVMMFLQARQMHSVGILAVLGVISIIVPCIFTVVVLVQDGRAEGATTQLYNADDSTVVAKGVAVMDIVFAFAGQVIFIELQRDMRNPINFPKAVQVSLVVMLPTFAVVAAVGYYYLGEIVVADGNPITSHLGDGVAKQTVNGCLFVHVFIAYVIEGNILTRGVAHICGLDQAVTGAGVHRLRWFLLSGAVVVGAFFIANLVPFFSDVMGLMAALCSLLLTYTFPIACGLRLLAMGKVERALCLVLLPISLLLAIAGTTASVFDIAAKLNQDTIEPFSCHGLGNRTSN